MNRQKLKQLVMQSYTDGELDAKKVNKIADLLTKTELKLYIRALKNWERQNQVFVDVPFDDVGLMDDFIDLFPGKKMTVNTDPSLLLGMRVTDNDDVYELSLKNALNKITEHIEEQYN